MFRSRESLCIIINNRPVSCKVDRLQRQTSECIIEAVRLRDFKARGDQSAASSEPVIPFSIPEVAHTELAVGEKQRRDMKFGDLKGPRLKLLWHQQSRFLTPNSQNLVDHDHFSATLLQLILRKNPCSLVTVAMSNNPCLSHTTLMFSIGV